MLVLVLASFAATQLASVSAWDYRLNGADWSKEGMCGAGGLQSPINLPLSAPAGEEEIAMFLKYPKLDTAVTVYNTGTSIAFTLPETFRAGFGVGKIADGIEKNVKEFEGSTDADAYRLWQVNFHSPSEHTINGERLPLEMQMMHQQVTGGEGLAVVVVLFSAAPNAYGALLDSVLGKSLPSKPQQETVQKPGLEFGPLLAGSQYYTYDGSLTVPPCEQQVKYFVRKEPVLAAHDQLRQFTDVLQANCEPKGNYRLSQAHAGKVSLVGAVDLVTAPHTMVKATRPTLQEEKAPSDAEAGFGDCNSEDLDYYWNNIDRVAATDNHGLVKAKIAYNSAHRDLQAQKSGIQASQRSVETLQGLYDNSPGSVEKIDVKWKLTAAETLLKAQVTGVAEKQDAVDAAGGILKTQILTGCNNWHMQEKKQLQEAQKASTPEAKKATRHWKYSEPHVTLPHGLGGSPFSTKEPDGQNIVVSAKIAPNLQQPEAPQSASTKEAKGENFGVAKGGGTDLMISLRLPLAAAGIANYNTFTADLKTTLAETSKIPESRLELKTVKPVQVQKVHKTSSLTQVDMKELQRRRLRHALV